MDVLLDRGVDPDSTIFLHSMTFDSGAMWTVQLSFFPFIAILSSACWTSGKKAYINNRQKLKRFPPSIPGDHPQKTQVSQVANTTVGCSRLSHDRDTLVQDHNALLIPVLAYGLAPTLVQDR